MKMRGRKFDKIKKWWWLLLLPLLFILWKPIMYLVKWTLKLFRSVIPNDENDMLSDLAYTFEKEFNNFNIREGWVIDELTRLNEYQLKKFYSVFGERTDRYYMNAGVSRTLFGFFRKYFNEKEKQKLRDLFKPTGLELTF